MVPTLQEMEGLCQKPQWREVGSWLARRIARPLALYLTWLIVHWPVSAHSVTAMALVVAGIGSVLLGIGNSHCFVVGCIMLELWYVLDHVDGQVARFRRRVSVTGIYLDYMMHHAVHVGLAFALGFGLARHSGELLWAVSGASLSLGTMLLAISNDCRYKAFHTAMTMMAGAPSKCVREPTISVSESASSSSVPATIPEETSGERVDRPRRMRNMLLAVHRGLLKICEIPSVLIALAGLATTMVVREDLGWLATHAYVATLAVTAPTLALARLAKQVWAEIPDKEFQEVARL